VNEIRFSIQLYANMEMAEMKQVEKIILTGGSSHLLGMSRYLSDALNMNVYRGDPWARVLYPKDLEHFNPTDEFHWTAVTRYILYRGKSCIRLIF